LLSKYGKYECLVIAALGLIGAGVCAWFALWWVIAIPVVLAAALLAFFRDPPRKISTEQNIMVSPADGHISSIHDVEHFEPFGEPALCVRVFLSVLDVHVNRSPCEGKVASITHTPGLKLNALNPKSAEVNEANLVVLHDPSDGHPVAAVRQVAGLIARVIVCGAKQDQVLGRGERFGLIKFGSTTELYVPKSANPEALVQLKQMVYGGSTVMVRLSPEAAADKDSQADQTEPAEQNEPASAESSS